MTTAGQTVFQLMNSGMILGRSEPFLVSRLQDHSCVASFRDIFLSSTHT